MNATIDQTIERVEALYTTLTGKRPPFPDGPGAPIPPETDAASHIQDQLGRMVSAVEGLVPSSPTSTWSPRAIVWIEASDIVLALDVPGVSRDQLRIRAEPSAITVSGQRTVPWSEPPRTVTGCEPPLGKFARSFPLATPVTAEHISARLEHGVLKIRIHGGPASEPSQISITS